MYCMYIEHRIHTTHPQKETYILTYLNLFPNQIFKIHKGVRFKIKTDPKYCYYSKQSSLKITFWSRRKK